MITIQNIFQNIFTGQFYQLPIFGRWLLDYERESLQEYFHFRGQVKYKERHEIETPVEFIDEAEKSRKFAFWLVLGTLIQDRPVYFWVGSLLFVFEIIKQPYDLIMQLT